MALKRQPVVVPLSDIEIESLEHLVNTSDLEKENCTICAGEIEPGQELISTRPFALTPRNQLPALFPFGVHHPLVQNGNFHQESQMPKL